MMNRTNTMTKVVRDVLMLRVKVWVILVFTISTVDELDVLTDTVEDNDRRVDGVSDDGKQAGDRCGTNGPLCEGVACNYNQYVMDKG